MKIRKFKPDDAEDLAKMISGVIGKASLHHTGRFAVKNLKKDYSASGLRIISKDIDLYVATKWTGKIVGCAGIAGNEVRAVFVDKNHMKQGIGRKLVRHMERLARRRGYSCARIESNKNAEHFFTKLGYEKSKTEKQRGKLIAIHMQKIFPQSLLAQILEILHLGPDTGSKQ